MVSSNSSGNSGSRHKEALQSLPRPVPPRFDWADSMFTVGVTGTNGKTSTAHLLAAAIHASGPSVMTQSTLGYAVDGVALDVPRSERGFHEAMERAVASGCQHAAVEVTSTALRNGYATRWRFDLGVFTNLSRDHLDQHGSFEHYLASKAQLFVHLGPGRSAVLNACDEAALMIDQVIPADVHRVWYAVPARGPILRDAALVAEHVELSSKGTTIHLADTKLAEQLGGTLSLQLLGDVFAENALAAAAAALTMGIEGDAVVRGLAACPVPPGRFEVLNEKPLVVVDYAHTPDALTRACSSARRLTPRGRLTVVFGAGGGRDAGKRPLMGESVSRRADSVIVTNDNPRNEDPAVIAEAIATGCRNGGCSDVRIVYDRAEAIRQALAAAGPDDVVLVAGRGHDEGMHFSNGVLPYNDPDTVRRVLSLLRAE